MSKKWSPNMLWRFTEEEEHALLAALERHWDDLWLACAEKEIRISRKEIYEQILKIPCVMAPAKDDIFVFDLSLKTKWHICKNSARARNFPIADVKRMITQTYCLNGI